MCTTDSVLLVSSKRVYHNYSAFITSFLGNLEKKTQGLQTTLFWPRLYAAQYCTYPENDLFL